MTKFLRRWLLILLPGHAYLVCVRPQRRFEGVCMGSDTRGPNAEVRRSRAQEIAADLEARILNERLQSGSRVGLRTDLIAQYSASPAVMNEALRILQERNL